MEWDIGYSDKFGEWWDGLTEGEQVSVRASVKLLGDFGPNLPFHHSSSVTTSQHGNMNCAFSTLVDLIVCSMLLILVGAGFC